MDPNTPDHRALQNKLALFTNPLREAKSRVERMYALRGTFAKQGDEAQLAVTIAGVEQHLEELQTRRNDLLATQPLGGLRPPASKDFT